MRRCALIAFVLAAVAGAQSSSHRAAAPPVPLMPCEHPQYTEEARLAHLTGTVLMALTVDDEGMPTDIHIVNPLGLGLDESAVACMSRARYSPAQKDGKPVPFALNIALDFQERWDSDWHLGAAAFHLSPGMARPVLVKAVFPASSADRRNLTVCVHFTIDKNGVPRTVAVATPQDRKLDKDATDIVAAWCFRPATQSGRPVEVPASLTLVHGAAARTVAGREPE